MTAVSDSRVSHSLGAGCCDSQLLAMRYHMPDSVEKLMIPSTPQFLDSSQNDDDPDVKLLSKESSFSSSKGMSKENSFLSCTSMDTPLSPASPQLSYRRRVSYRPSTNELLSFSGSVDGAWQPRPPAPSHSSRCITAGDSGMMGSPAPHHTESEGQFVLCNSTSPGPLRNSQRPLLSRKSAGDVQLSKLPASLDSQHSSSLSSLASSPRGEGLGQGLLSMRFLKSSCQAPPNCLSTQPKGLGGQVTPTAPLSPPSGLQQRLSSARISRDNRCSVDDLFTSGSLAQKHSQGDMRAIPLMGLREAAGDATSLERLAHVSKSATGVSDSYAVETSSKSTPQCQAGLGMRKSIIRNFSKWDLGMLAGDISEDEDEC